MLYIVSYIPQRTIRNNALLRTVQSFDAYAMLSDTTFLIEAFVSASTVRDRIKPHLRPNDQLFVGKLDRSAAWTGFDPGFSQWIRGVSD